MPRKAIGPRPLTPAERQAHQREKHKQQQEAMKQELARLRTENEALQEALEKREAK